MELIQIEQQQNIVRFSEVSHVTEKQSSGAQVETRWGGASPKFRENILTDNMS